MLTLASRTEGISRAQYMREGMIMRAGFTFAHVPAGELADLRERIGAIERRLGIDPPNAAADGSS